MQIINANIKKGKVKLPWEFSADAVWILLRDTQYNDGECFVQVCNKKHAAEFLKNISDTNIVYLDQGEFSLSSRGQWTIPQKIRDALSFDEAVFSYMYGDEMTIQRVEYFHAEMERIMDEVKNMEEIRDLLNLDE